MKRISLALLAILVGVGCTPSSLPPPSEPARATDQEDFHTPMATAVPSSVAASPSSATSSSSEPDRPLGDVRIVLEPPQAPIDFEVRFIGGDGYVSTVPEKIAAGSSEPVFRTQYGGEYRIRVNDVTCDGIYDVSNATRTLVVVDISSTPCRISVTGYEELPY